MSRIVLTRRNFHRGLALGSSVIIPQGRLFADTMATVDHFGATGNGHVDDTQAFNAAAAASPVLLIPPGDYRIDGDVLFKDIKLIIQGHIFCKGALRFAGDVQVSGPGVISSLAAQAGFRFETAGSFVVRGLHFEDCQSTAAIFISPPPDMPIRSIAIRNCSFKNSNYGIMRSGRTRGSVQTAIVSDNMFSGLRGDAIEFDLAMNDGPILIENNTIDVIDNIQAKPFWGIGIGVSGDSYTRDHDPAHSAKKFIIRNNKLNDLVQGIHVEAGRDFIIEGNTINTINKNRSRNTGLANFGIVAYGCANFSIRNNIVHGGTGGYAIVASSGWNHGQFLSDNVDYDITGNDAAGAGPIATETKFGSGTVTIRKNNADSFVHAGAVDKLTFSENTALDSTLGINLGQAQKNGVAAASLSVCRNKVAGQPFSFTQAGNRGC